MQAKMVEISKEYLDLLYKDSAILECIDALDILTLKEWQQVSTMYEEELQ